jgi:hypothetical protein
MNKAPNWVIAVCVTVFLMGCITAFVVLSVTGSSADEFSRFLNTGLNLLGLFLGGGAWLTASSANEGVHDMKRQIKNGGELDSQAIRDLEKDGNGGQ